MLARHHPSARSSSPSGGAAYGSMNAADPPRSSSGGGCPQQTSSAQDPPASPASPVPGRPSGSAKFTSRAVTNRSGCSERTIMACSRTAMPARLGSVQARSRQAFSTDRPVRLAGRPVPMTSPTSRRTPNGVAITSWISPPPPWVAGRWRDSTYSRPTCVEAGRVMVGSPGGNSIDCSQPTTTCCANREVPVAASQLVATMTGRLLSRRGAVAATAPVLPALMSGRELLVLAQLAQHLAAVGPQRGREQKAPSAVGLLTGQQDRALGE